MSELHIGDRVYLKHSQQSPSMTVTAVEVDHEGRYKTETMWFNETDWKFQREFFDPRALVLTSTDNDTDTNPGDGL